MKYNKLIGKLLSSRTSSNNTQVAVALVAGVAVGAVISILFAPSKGSNMRNSIAGKARDLGSEMRDSYRTYRDKMFGNHPQENVEAPEVPHFAHSVPKKRKSDIKTLINEDKGVIS
ncbi:YtxH domain-containing protein [Pedobacter insulae]|nr:YtxH domain-containing protein [Pedobacter insulae]